MSNRVRGRAGSDSTFRDFSVPVAIARMLVLHQRHGPLVVGRRRTQLLASMDYHAFFDTKRTFPRLSFM